MYSKGELTYPKRLSKKKTFIGDFKKPVAYGTYEEIYSNLDDEFYRILGLFSWYNSGLLKIDINSIPYEWVLGLKYLVDITAIQQRIF